MYYKMSSMNIELITQLFKAIPNWSRPELLQIYQRDGKICVEFQHRIVGIFFGYAKPRFNLENEMRFTDIVENVELEQLYTTREVIINTVLTKRLNMPELVDAFDPHA